MRLQSPELDTAGTGVPDPRHVQVGTRHSDRLLAVALRFIQFGPGVILVALFAAMTLLSPYFLTGGNMQNLGAQTSIVATLAIGQLLVILARGIDISVGAVLAFSAVVPAVLFGSESGFLFIVVALLAGLAVGVVNGTLIVFGRVAQPLIVTVAMLGIVQGLALIVSGGKYVVGLPPVIREIGNAQIGPIPITVVIVLAIAVGAHLFLARTRWGRWIYATGGDPEAAGRLGIPTGKIVFSVYALCATLAAVAGLLTAGRTDSAVPTAGTGYEIDAITAVIIGGASLFGGRGSVAGALIGALILGTIRNGLDLLSVEPFYQTVAIGVVVLIALELDAARGWLENRLRVLQATER